MYFSPADNGPKNEPPSLLPPLWIRPCHGAHARRFSTTPPHIRLRRGDRPSSTCRPVSVGSLTPRRRQQMSPPPPWDWGYVTPDTAASGRKSRVMPRGGTCGALDHRISPTGPPNITHRTTEYHPPDHRTPEYHPPDHRTPEYHPRDHRTPEYHR